MPFKGNKTTIQSRFTVASLRVQCNKISNFSYFENTIHKYNNTDCLAEIYTKRKMGRGKEKRVELFVMLFFFFFNWIFSLVRVKCDVMEETNNTISVIKAERSTKLRKLLKELLSWTY